MVISIVNGSPRIDGSTAKILKEIAGYLSQKNGITVKYFDLAKYDMKFCKGCARCDSTGQCVIPGDGIDGILKEIKKSDGIVLGSPCYVSNVTGQLKAFFDRAHIFIIEQALTNKYGFAVGTYETADGDKAIKIINNFFLVSGASRRGNFLLKLDYDSDPFSRGKVKQRLHEKIEKFYQAIKSKEKKSLFEYIFSKALIRLFFKPFYRKHPEKYGRVLKMWEEKGIR